MSDGAVDQLLEVERLFGGVDALLAAYHQKVGAHHATVEPVDLTATANAADDSDIRSVDLRDDFADEVFRQSISIGRAGRLFVHSHSRRLPRKSHLCSYCVHNLTGRKRKHAHQYPYNYGYPEKIESNVPSAELPCVPCASSHFGIRQRAISFRMVSEEPFEGQKQRKPKHQTRAERDQYPIEHLTLLEAGAP